MPRYIDAEKLKEKMFGYYSCLSDTQKPDYRFKGETLMDWEVSDMIDDCIDNAETADVREVKRGEWIKDHGWYSHHCSNCGRSTSDYLEEDGDWYDRVFNYCPNCGARMEVEDN